MPSTSNLFAVTLLALVCAACANTPMPGAGTPAPAASPPPAASGDHEQSGDPFERVGNDMKKR